MKNLLIVESPAKAKTIQKYLGKNYEIIASFGHIRNLVNKSGSVDVENNFEMKYEVSRGSGKHVNEIISKVKKAENLILSPDPDREGEAIAWHIFQVLQNKKALKNIKKIQRVTFNSITKASIQEAIKNPRNIDDDLVNSQQSRVALDYLVGFTISPILWRKLPGTKSAGRVQSVALRMICDREDEIKKFNSEEYWTISAKFNEIIEANLTHLEEKKLAKLDIKNQNQANQISQNLQNKVFEIAEINEKNVSRKPYPPLNTSSLQQDSSRKLGFSAKKTMSVAQSLYEGINLGKETEGLITYMRTDSLNIEPAEIKNIRQFILEKFGEKYLPKSPNIYKTKAKNAQEAHEAIRPTNISRSPDEIKNFLNNDQFKLYDLIWRRTLASQFSNMISKQTAIIIKTIPNYATLKANYSQIVFKGFDILFSKKDDKNKSIPNIKISEKLNLSEIIPNQHFTEPLPRYNEASLVKRMEELGVGRPSTYASIISVLKDRKYVKYDNKKFIAEQRGSILTSFLKNFFAQYVKYEYTAEVENNLDLISDGKLKWKEFLHKFWNEFNVISKDAGEKSIDDILKVINQEMGLFVFDKDENGNLKDDCPSCGNGKLSIKLGKFGSFLGCSNYPDCKYINNIDGENDGSSGSGDLFEDKIIATHDETKKNIILKKGPYGFYLELEVDEKNENQEKDSKKKRKKNKPKRVSIPRNISLEDVDAKKANELISLPRLVGINPDNNLEIKANFGPYGPYLLYDKVFYSVRSDDILTIDINRSLEIIKEGKKKKFAKKQKT